jgi:hypothetical protein
MHVADIAKSKIEFKPFAQNAWMALEVLLENVGP